MRTGLDILNENNAEAMKKYSMSLDELETEAKKGKEWAFKLYVFRIGSYTRRAFEFVATYHSEPQKWCARVLLSEMNESEYLDYHFGKMCKKTGAVEFLQQRMISTAKSFVFADKHELSCQVVRANGMLNCVHIYETKTKEALARMDAWSLCGMRLNICKDMRVYIAKAIWKSEFFNENQDK